MSDKPSVEFLREALRLDSVTGRLFWRVRPREHFISEEQWHVFNRHKAGKPADISTFPVSQYRRVRMKYRRKCIALAAHRVVFALVHGRWPTNVIDHLNRCRQDNRPENLRDVTVAENLKNTGRHGQPLRADAPAPLSL